MTTVRGRVVSTSEGTVALKDGYDTYVVHLDGVLPAAGFEVGQELEVKASSRRRDQQTGAIVLVGTSSCRPLPSGRRTAAKDAPSYGEWVAADPSAATTNAASAAAPGPPAPQYDPNAKFSPDLVKRLDPNLARLIGMEPSGNAAAGAERSAR